MPKQEEQQNELTKRIAPLLDLAVEFLSKIDEKGHKIRDRAKEDYGSGELSAHQLAVGVFAQITMSMMEPGMADKTTVSKMTLLASFGQGILITEKAISEGLYVQAGALVRQELETIAKLEGIMKGTNINGKAGHLSNVRMGMRKIYSGLSRFTHISEDRLLKFLLSGSIPGFDVVTITQHYQRDLSKDLYAIHTALVIQAAMILGEVRKTMYRQSLSDLEKMCLGTAYKILVDEGFFLSEQCSRKRHPSPGNP